MKLFNEEGHITDQGFRALIAGELNGLDRLEAAEHLDCCDLCVERYSQMLVPEVEIAPKQELAPEILRTLRRRARALFLNRFTRVAVAAVLTMVIWVGGFYRNGILSPSGESMEEAAAAAQSLQDQLWSWGRGLDQLVSGMDGLLGQSLGRNPQP